MEPGSSTAPASAGAPGDVDIIVHDPHWRRVVIVDDPRWRRVVIVDDPRWRRVVRRAEAVAARAAAAAGVPVDAVVLSSDRAVQRLNHRHRGRNKPTNVLTFDPSHAGAGGDIVLALGTVRREAAQAKRRPAHHLAHLVVHGALHLRGHDHGRAGDARRMEMAEARILHRLRVPNPWKRA